MKQRLLHKHINQLEHSENCNVFLSQQGLTLVELIVGIVIVGILVGWAFPGFVGMVEQVRYNQSRDMLVDTINTARNEAVFNGRTLVACASDNLHSSIPSCSADQLDWNTGWMIYQECGNNATFDHLAISCDLDRDGVVDSPETIIQTFEPPDYPIAKSEDSAIVFFPTGLVDGAATFRVGTSKRGGTVGLTRSANIVSRGLNDPYPRLAN